MKNLIKYEIRKTWLTKLVILGITAVVEAAFLICLALKDENGIGLTTALLSFIAIGGILFIGIESVITLHRDMNTRQSYMLFMTPNSCYKILGAKVIENGLSLLAAGAFFFLLAFVDVTALFGRYNEFSTLWETFNRLITVINQEIKISADSLACLCTAMLCSWLCVVITAYLADVVSSALLNGKRMNGLVSFLLFILLDGAVMWLQNQVHGSFNVQTALLLRAAVAMGCSALMYLLTAYLMDRYLSV